MACFLNRQLAQSSRERAKYQLFPKLKNNILIGPPLMPPAVAFALYHHESFSRRVTL